MQILAKNRRQSILLMKCLFGFDRKISVKKNRANNGLGHAYRNAKTIETVILAVVTLIWSMRAVKEPIMCLATFDSAAYN